MKSESHKTVEEYKQIALDLSKLDTFSHEHHYMLVNLANKRTLTLKDKRQITKLQELVLAYA